MSRRLEAVDRRVMERSSRVLACVLLGLGAMTPGCAGLSPNRPVECSRLVNSEELTEAELHINGGLGLQRDRTLVADRDALSRVGSFFIEPPVWAVDQSTRAGRDEAFRVMLSAVMESALRERLSTILPVVAKPGPTTAIVRTYITDAQLTWPYIRHIGVSYPYIAMGTAGAEGERDGKSSPVAEKPTLRGGACVEAEVVTPEGLRVAAISCDSTAGPLDVAGFLFSDGHAKKAMQRAAKELQEALHPAPGRPQG
ncbi:DUF3313 family protein [Singulisphaera sp. PoT]|uniref:DUF3313 family protein n=1 Tax=Singulisphaera sp. PoT TaxID=3411797 RepID=UPI003BF5180C